MAYLTEYNFSKLCNSLDLKNDVDKEMFLKLVYDDEGIFSILNKRELKYIFKCKSILEDEIKFRIDYYQELPETTDTRTLVFEDQTKIKYHLFSDCKALQMDYDNVYIPQDIHEYANGQENPSSIVEEFRKWFKGSHFLQKYLQGEISKEKIIFQYNSKYPKIYNIKPITDPNSGLLFIHTPNSNSVEIEGEFNLKQFLEQLEETKKQYNNAFHGSVNRTLVKFRSISNKSDNEIQDIFDNLFTKGFTKNLGIETIKTKIELAKKYTRTILQLLLNYFKWKYKFREKNFDTITLEHFNLVCCGYCKQKNEESNPPPLNFHSEEYTQNKHDKSLNESYLIENWSFFNSVFSTHYPFTTEQLINLKNEICWGGCVYSFYDSNFMHFYQPPPGAAFNSSIIWTKSLIEIADFECNYLAAEYYDEELIPLDKRTELEHYDSESISILGSQWSNKENLELAFENYNTVVDLFDYKYDSLNVKELHQIIKNFNEKKSSTKAIIFNNSFYNGLMDCIKQELNDFDIPEFYEKLKMTSLSLKKTLTNGKQA